MDEGLFWTACLGTGTGDGPAGLDWTGLGWARLDDAFPVSCGVREREDSGDWELGIGADQQLLRHDLSMHANRSRATGLEPWTGRLAGLECHVPLFRTVQATAAAQKTERGHRGTFSTPAVSARNHTAQSIEKQAHKPSKGQNTRAE